MYNDNELLYLISENDDEALEILIEKYKNLIRSKIKSFKFEKEVEKEYFLVGLEMLDKAIKLYQKEKNLSFNRFFEIILERKFIDLYRKEKSTELLIYNNELIDQVIDYNTIEEKIKIDYFKFELSEFEKLVYKEIYIEKRSVEDTCLALNCERKRIYDAIARIKKKLL